MSYTIYTLSAPAERIEWKDIRYIGMSIDIFTRFKQHLTSHDDTNPEKTTWIQRLLAQGHKPALGMIEEVGRGRKRGNPNNTGYALRWHREPSCSIEPSRIPKKNAL